MTDNRNAGAAIRPHPARRRDRGYGILLALGIFLGFAVGLLLDQPSAGTVIGLGVGGLAAIVLRLTSRA